MDPNAAWAALLEAYRTEDPDACRQACRDLSEWLAKGGFPPEITGIQALDRIMTQAGCNASLTVPSG